MVVSRQIRLYNFLLDSFVFLVVVWVIAISLKTVLSRDSLKWVMIAFYYLYYFVLESAFGQTIGKMVTGTRVSESGTERKPSLPKIFLRTILRMIPVDIFSYLIFDHGFHDRYSSTRLIKSKVDVLS